MRKVAGWPSAVAYRFGDLSRLGLQFYRLPNGGLDDRSPRTEVPMLAFSLPLRQGTARP